MVPHKAIETPLQYLHKIFPHRYCSENIVAWVITSNANEACLVPNFIRVASGLVNSASQCVSVTSGGIQRQNGQKVAARRRSLPTQPHARVRGIPSGCFSC